MAVTVTLMVTALAFIVTALIPARYRSDLSVLVIQKQSSTKVDAFSAAKSAEFLSDILAKVIETDAFLEDVKSSPYETKDFPVNPEERRKEWDKAVEVKTINNTGIIKVAVLDRSRQEAESIAQAISWALSVRGHKYHGGGTRVIIRALEGPITSSQPAVPNLWLNTLIGFVVGLLGSVGLILFFQDLNFKLFNGRRVDYQSNIQEQIKAQLNWQPKEEKKVVEKKEPEKEEQVEEEAPAEEIMEEDFSQEEKEEKNYSMETKAAAPENLPISDEPKPSAQDRALGFAPEREESPSEDEVKERLNRLIKGDL